MEKDNFLQLVNKEFPSWEMRSFRNWIIKNFPRFPQILKISLDRRSRRSRLFAGLQYVLNKSIWSLPRGVRCTTQSSFGGGSIFGRLVSCWYFDTCISGTRLTRIARPKCTGRPSWRSSCWGDPPWDLGVFKPMAWSLDLITWLNSDLTWLDRDLSW